MDKKPLVSIVMGSDSDLEIMNEAAKALAEFGIPYEIDITSAHRSPARTSEYSRGLKARGVKVVIAGAGGAAHLAGVIAAETTLQVIGLYDDAVARKLEGHKGKLAEGVEAKSRKLKHSHKS